VSNIDHHAERAVAHQVSRELSTCGRVGALNRFIHDDNLKDYRKQLSETTEDCKRQMLIRLIRDEILADLREPNATLSASLGSCDS
jgi:hypothetical protein